MTGRTQRFDLAIIGAGSGGLSLASGAAQLGLKVALFESGEMGGDCLNSGCVPSKALIAAARAARSARRASALGVKVDVQVDFAAVMAHVRRTITTIAPIDSQARFEGLGVTVIREHARFTGPRSMASERYQIRFDKAVIAAGSRPRLPPITGLADGHYLTNETLWTLTEQPGHLIVLGGGPIGLEMAQAFAQLGSIVTVVEADKILARESEAAVASLRSALQEDGLRLREGVQVGSVRYDADGVELTLISGERLTGTHLLVATGREPRLEGLGLDAARVAATRSGITVDKSLRTSNPNIYALGDIIGRPAFTHAAGAQAGLLVRRLLFAQSIDVEALLVPRATYTTPEVAAVGLSEVEARQRFGRRVTVLTSPFHDNDRAVAEGASEGFGQVIVGPGGRALGAVLVGEGAGDLIQTWSLMISARLGLTALTSLIAPYPTRGEINKRLAGQFYSPVLFAPRTRVLVSLLRRFA